MRFYVNWTSVETTGINSFKMLPHLFKEHLSFYYLFLSSVAEALSFLVWLLVRAVSGSVWVALVVHPCLTSPVTLPLGLRSRHHFLFLYCFVKERPLALLLLRWASNGSPSFTAVIAFLKLISDVLNCSSNKSAHLVDSLRILKLNL